MLRHSPNHGTLRLLNDVDDDECMDGEVDCVLDKRSRAVASRGWRFQDSESTNVNASGPSGDNVDDRWHGR